MSTVSLAELLAWTTRIDLFPINALVYLRQLGDLVTTNVQVIMSRLNALVEDNGLQRTSGQPMFGAGVAFPGRRLGLGGPEDVAQGAQPYDAMITDTLAEMHGSKTRGRAMDALF
jgi:hypothetical protein